MHKVHFRIYVLVALPLLYFTLHGDASQRVRQPHQPETLSIPDFNRLGQDASVDWLRRGLADMMIAVMDRVSPYRVIYGPRLNAILQTHRIPSNSLAVIATTDTPSEMDKSDYFVIGNFTRQATTLTVEARLIRLIDHQILATATWQGDIHQLTSAPRALSETLLSDLDIPFDAGLLKGIEKRIPTTTDSAESFYKGLMAFEDEKFAESLAYYRNGGKIDRTFTRINEEIIRVYEHLEQPLSAVRFARDTARRLATDDVRQAMSFYFTAVEISLTLHDDPDLPSAILEQMIKVAEGYETRTGEAEKTKRIIRDRARMLYQAGTYKSPLYALGHRELRYLLWYEELDDQLSARRTEGDYLWTQNGNRWQKLPIPAPSVWMWEIRARLILARLYRQANHLSQALALYKSVIRDYDFVRHLMIPDDHKSFYWTDGIRSELLPIVLRQYQKTGQQVHGDMLMSGLNEVFSGFVFERTFDRLDKDPRAAAWSRRADGGHENFHFVAPHGYQIDAVTLDAEIIGIAKFSIELPATQERPANITKWERSQLLTLFQGTHTKRIEFAPGTDFFSLNTMWGIRWADTQMEFYRGMGGKSPEQNDIIWWRATFAVSPRQEVPVVTR